MSARNQFTDYLSDQVSVLTTLHADAVDERDGDAAYIVADLIAETLRAYRELAETEPSSTAAGEPRSATSDVEAICAGCKAEATYRAGALSWCAAHGPAGTIAKAEDAERNGDTA